MLKHQSAIAAAELGCSNIKLPLQSQNMDARAPKHAVKSRSMDARAPKHAVKSRFTTLRLRRPIGPRNEGSKGACPLVLHGMSKSMFQGSLPHCPKRHVQLPVPRRLALLLPSHNSLFYFILQLPKHQIWIAFPQQSNTT